MKRHNAKKIDLTPFPTWRENFYRELKRYIKEVEG